MKEIIAQWIGVAACVLMIASFQCKKNERLFLMQGIGGFLFFINYLLIGAISGALFNLVNLVRGITLMKKDRKAWKIAVINILYTACFAISLFKMSGGILQIILSALTFSVQIIMSIFMWLGNARHIRYCQVAYASPAWLVYNVFNFTLGGIACEVFNIASVIISLIRYGKKGFEE